MNIFNGNYNILKNNVSIILRKISTNLLETPLENSDPIFKLFRSLYFKDFDDWFRPSSTKTDKITSKFSKQQYQFIPCVD